MKNFKIGLEQRSIARFDDVQLQILKGYILLTFYLYSKNQEWILANKATHRRNKICSISYVAFRFLECPTLAPSTTFSCVLMRERERERGFDINRQKDL